MKSLKTQVSQLVNTVGRLKAQGSGKLLSHIVVNPWEKASAVTLRSGKTLETPPTMPKKTTHEEEGQRKEKKRKHESVSHFLSKGRP